jgi:hypothetical protein
MEGEEEKERKQFFVVDRSFHISVLSEARLHESVKLGEVLCIEGGRWRLRWMRANGWTRSNGYGN